MKYRILLFGIVSISILCLFICIASGNISKWKMIFEKPVICIEISPTNQIYVSVPNMGIYSSIDLGESWQDTSGGIESLDIIYSIAIAQTNPETIYAEGIKWLYKSIDAGVSWKKIRKKVSLSELVEVDPRDSNIVYAGRFKSIDGGKTWRKMIDETEIPLGFWLHDVELNPRSPEIVYISDHPYGNLVELQKKGLMGIYKSIDGGETWITINKERTTQIAIDSIHTQTIYAGGENGIYKSIDGGETWQLMNRGLPDSMVQLVLIDVIDNRVVYAVIQHKVGIFFSQDSGETWKKLGKEFPTNGLCYELAINPSEPNILYLATTAGLWGLELEPRESHSIQPLGKLSTIWASIKDY